MLPLEGVKVVEFCQVLAGPYCGMLLADMGADVIKVEPPDGDMMRQWPPITDGYSENFASINRNKRSVVLDLKNPEHKAAARRLVLAADVVLENNRPGVMDRLGLGYESFRQGEARPRLLLDLGLRPERAALGRRRLRRHGAGDERHHERDRRAEGGAPVKCGVPVSDTGTGLYAAFAIVSLLRRVAGGRRGRAYRCLDAGLQPRHGRAADQRIFRHRPRSEEARLGPSAQRALPGLSGAPTAISSSPPATTSCGKA